MRRQSRSTSRTRQCRGRLGVTDRGGEGRGGVIAEAHRPAALTPLHSGIKRNSGNGNWVDGCFESKIELQFCREGHWIAIIDHVVIWDEAQNLLLFFDLHLLGCLLHGIVGDIDRSAFRLNPKLNVGQDLKLSGLKDESRRMPICKSFCADADLIWDSWFHIVKFEISIVVGDDTLAVAGVWIFEKDHGARNSVVVHIGHRARNCAFMKFGDLPCLS